MQEQGLGKVTYCTMYAQDGKLMADGLTLNEMLGMIPKKAGAVISEMRNGQLFRLYEWDGTKWQCSSNGRTQAP